VKKSDVLTREEECVVLESVGADLSHMENRPHYL
jgi:hypothetical protein